MGAELTVSFAVDGRRRFEGTPFSLMLEVPVRERTPTTARSANARSVSLHAEGRWRCICKKSTPTRSIACTSWPA
jgi:hypothetical protein